MFLKHMKPRITSLPDCSTSNGNIFVDSISILSFTISIPIFEFLIYPFLRKHVRTTVRIGLGMGVAVLGLSVLLAIDTVGHVLASSDGSKICMFYDESLQDSVTNSIPIHSLVLVPVIFIMAVAEMLIFISTFEFICAQAPYGMRGLIIGIYFMISGISVGLVSILLLGFSLGYSKYSSMMKMSCGTCYMMVVVVMGCVGGLVYAAAAKCYRERQRGGQRDVNYQTILEGYYESKI